MPFQVRLITSFNAANFSYTSVPILKVSESEINPRKCSIRTFQQYLFKTFPEEMEEYFPFYFLDGVCTIALDRYGKVRLSQVLDNNKGNVELSLTEIRGPNCSDCGYPMEVVVSNVVMKDQDVYQVFKSYTKHTKSNAIISRERIMQESVYQAIDIQFQHMQGNGYYQCEKESCTGQKQLTIVNPTIQILSATIVTKQKEIEMRKKSGIC